MVSLELKFWRKISQITHLKYSVRDGCVTITLARGKEQRRQKSEAFDRIFSHHVYAVAKKGISRDFAENLRVTCLDTEFPFSSVSIMNITVGTPSKE